MAIRTRIDPVEVVTEATRSSEPTLPEARRAAAAFAREGIEEAARTNQRILGRRPRQVNFVDGRRDAPLETVNPDGGQIITEFDLVTDVLRWIADALFEASPFRSGAYREARRCCSHSPGSVATSFRTPRALSSIWRRRWIRTYGTGGLVGDEVPVIARRGEGIFTPAQMRALGSRGSSIVVSPVINITSQGGDVNEQRLLGKRVAQYVKASVRQALIEERRGNGLLAAGATSFRPALVADRQQPDWHSR